MTITRRSFLKGTGVALTAFALPGPLARMARAAGSDPVLVVLFQRGAADWLNLVVPAGDDAYYALRPNIQVAPGSELALDGFFGLNPALAALLPLYQAGELAFVHACGSPDGTRSHFDAQDNMERAAPGNPLVGDGWLNRSLTALGAADTWSGVTLGPATVLALAGPAPSLALPSVDEFDLLGPTGRRGVLETIYASATPPDLARAGREAFSALDVIGGVSTATEVAYPAGPLGEALADAAALIRADIGVRIVAIDVGGWDHHEHETGAMAGVAGGLAAALAAFRQDLGDDFGRTCTLTMTEFGRTAAENGTLGTDHGHGSAMLALGGGVAGGQVLLAGGAWPGLGAGQLFEGRDLAATTDFRDVFAEVLCRHLGLSAAGAGPVLPSHTITTASFPGLFA